MKELKHLNLAHNELKSLPDSICKLEELEWLAVSENDLDSLPEDIGLYVTMFNAGGNRLTSIPKSIVESSDMMTLDFAANQLTSLPEGLEDLDLQVLDLECNFLDVSEDSRWRKALDSNPSDLKKFMHQLTLPVVSAQAAPDSVTLSWTPGVDGDAIWLHWKVTGYDVYRNINGEMTRLAEFGSDVLSFTDAGLQPAAEYDYRVAVIYMVTDEDKEFEDTTQWYASVSVTTAADETVSPTAMISDTTVIVTPAPSSVGTATAGVTLRERPGIPWPVYAGAGGLLLAGAGVTTVLTIRKRRGGRKQK